MYEDEIEDFKLINEVREYFNFRKNEEEPNTYIGMPCSNNGCGANKNGKCLMQGVYCYGYFPLEG